VKRNLLISDRLKIEVIIGAGKKANMYDANSSPDGKAFNTCPLPFTSIQVNVSLTSIAHCRYLD
tara:strand:+ start:4116 stop:4307 length:192 start_codon:yes stop_codon:yes gene_type:complete